MGGGARIPLTRIQRASVIGNPEHSVRILALGEFRPVSLDISEQEVRILSRPPDLSLFPPRMIGVTLSRPMPFDKLRKFKVTKWAAKDSMEGGTDDREEVRSLRLADVVTSEFEDAPGIHTLALDIDLPAALVPSSTPGHSHLYIACAMTWEQYARILDALADAGILEPGYVGASKARKATSVRLPWVSKPEEPFDLEWGTF